MKDLLDPLETIVKVETPPFLLTRIIQRIDSERNAKFSSGVSWSMGVAFILLILLNTGVLTNVFARQHNMQTLAQSFQIMPNNELYHEQN